MSVELILEKYLLLGRKTVTSKSEEHCTKNFINPVTAHTDASSLIGRDRER